MRMMRLTVFSLLIVTACAGVPRPDTDLCTANAPAKHWKCYNLLKDYDDRGQRNPEAKATFKPLNSISDANKMTGTDPKGFGNLKAYINKLKAAAEQRCQ